MQSIDNHIMRTECPTDMKQTALERQFHKFILYAKNLILTHAQFRLVLPCCLTYRDRENGRVDAGVEL